MTTGKTIAPHEVMELHELLAFKNLCATKSATMAALVKDEELKGMLQQDFTASQSHIKELQTLMQQGADWTVNASQSTNTAAMQ